MSGKGTNQNNATKKTQVFEVVSTFKHGEKGKEYKKEDKIELTSQKAIDHLKFKGLIK